MLISENFSENPYSICKQNEVNPEDLIIIVVNDGDPETQIKISQFKQHYKDISIFSLTGAMEFDNFEIDKINKLYNFYEKKKFREFISNYPDETWEDSQTVKKFIDEI